MIPHTFHHRGSPAYFPVPPVQLNVPRTRFCDEGALWITYNNGCVIPRAASRRPGPPPVRKIETKGRVFLAAPRTRAVTALPEPSPPTRAGRAVTTLPCPGARRPQRHRPRRRSDQASETLAHPYLHRHLAGAHEVEAADGAAAGASLLRLQKRLRAHQHPNLRDSSSGRMARGAVRLRSYGHASQGSA